MILHCCTAKQGIISVQREGKRLGSGFPGANWFGGHDQRWVRLAKMLHIRFARDSRPSAAALEFIIRNPQSAIRNAGGSARMRLLTVPTYLTAADYTIDSDFGAK
jgi:hypothetical protein